MTELLTAAQMRALEAAAIASGEVTGLELMERAGKGVVEAIFEEWPELATRAHRAVVLCGPGGNGGDGFVVAWLLRDAGWAVEVFLYGDPERMPPDARVNYERWLEMGEVREWPASGDEPRRPHDPWASDLIIDAIFGTGLTRPIPFTEPNIGTMLPEGDLRDERGRPRIVAVDVPSGLCADSGSVLADSDALWADLTVTFHTAKVGHFLGEGEAQSGKINVVSIGLELARIPSPLVRLGQLFVQNFRPVELVNAPVADWIDKFDAFGRQTHKFSHGHALILSGGVGHGGAARLAARGSLRIGAGLVTIGCPPSALIENAAHLNAIMLKRVPDADALAEVLADARITALCLGPGMGTGPREAALLAVALGLPLVPGLTRDLDQSDATTRPEGASQADRDPRANPAQFPAKRPTVLDADALTLLAQNPALFAALHKDCILTPHAGEFARLFPDIAARLAEPATRGPAYSKVDATRDAAKRAACVVLFKGPDTVIADPSGRCSINSAHYDRAAPWLATAGSGDVLSGFITGLLARGFAPFDAACTAAWLHVECARSFGPGLIAEDLPEELPKVFRGLGL